MTLVDLESVTRPCVKLWRNWIKLRNVGTVFDACLRNVVPMWAGNCNAVSASLWFPKPAKVEVKNQIGVLSFKQTAKIRADR